MVTEFDTTQPPGHAWLLRPTRSMTWPQAKRCILLIAIFCLSIGILFAGYGLPLVMPFSGLEVVAVAVAFYLVLRDGERQELVRFDGGQLVIETGTQQLDQRVEFNRFWVRVELKRSRYRYHPTRLYVGTHGRAIELGHFLTDSERETFSRLLINALKKNR